MWAQVFVKGVEYLRKFEGSGFFCRFRKGLPEIAQDSLPIQATIRNIVELFFQGSRKSVFDIAFEETSEESRH